MSAPEQPRQPRGEALDWDDETIDQEAHVSERDDDAALRWWRKHAAPRDRGLIEPTRKVDR